MTRDPARAGRAATATPPKYLLVDSCVVATYYIPESARHAKLPERARILIESIGRDSSGRRVLLIPNFCIGEVFGVFAKYRFGKWNKQVKKRIDDIQYRLVRLRFHNDIHNGMLFQQYELSRYHILAADLISTVDHKYEYYRSRRKKNRKIPMGTFDHLIIAMGIELVKSRGWENVLLVTADHRLAHITGKATRVKRASAATLGLIRIASDLGLEYGPRIYPRVLNIATAGRARLQECLGEWPILAGSVREDEKTDRLSELHKEKLVTLYRRLATVNPDSMGYSDEFEILYDKFLAETGLKMTRNRVLRALVNLRKAHRLPTRDARRGGLAKYQA